jgi:group I intron endonuclease
MRGVVYKYTSPSGKVYIGQTYREKGRRKEFRSSRPYSNGFLINNARKKYGPKNFTYEVLYEIISDDGDMIRKELDNWEMFYIEKYHSNDRRYGYNMNKGGSGNAGCYYSPETRAKMGENSRRRLAIYNPMKGKKHRPESIALMKANTKRKYGKDNPNYGWQPPRELLDRLAEMSRQRTGEKNPFFWKDSL